MKENERVEAAIKILQLKGGKKSEVLKSKMAANINNIPNDEIEAESEVCVPDKLGVRPQKAEENNGKTKENNK